MKTYYHLRMRRQDGTSFPLANVLLTRERLRAFARELDLLNHAAVFRRMDLQCAPLMLDLDEKTCVVLPHGVIGVDTGVIPEDAPYICFPSMEDFEAVAPWRKAVEIQMRIDALPPITTPMDVAPVAEEIEDAFCMQDIPGTAFDVLMSQLYEHQEEYIAGLGYEYPDLDSEDG